MLCVMFSESFAPFQLPFSCVQNRETDSSTIFFGGVSTSSGRRVTNIVPPFKNSYWDQISHDHEAHSRVQGVN